jgi:FlaG/FlaF family flagellin (archaellin)
MVSKLLQSLALTATLGATTGTLVLGSVIPAASAEGQHGATAVTCTNPISGATFQIKIDYDASTVDANPARFSDSQIRWKASADGGNYTLDRKTGNLTVVMASSTGGSFLYDRCKLDN